MQVELFGGPKDGEVVPIRQYVPTLEFFRRRETSKTPNTGESDNPSDYYRIIYDLVSQDGKMKYVYRGR